MRAWSCGLRPSHHWLTSVSVAPSGGFSSSISGLVGVSVGNSPGVLRGVAPSMPWEVARSTAPNCVSIVLSAVLYAAATSGVIGPVPDGATVPSAPTIAPSAAAWLVRSTIAWRSGVMLVPPPSSVVAIVCSRSRSSVNRAVFCSPRACAARDAVPCQPPARSPRALRWAAMRESTWPILVFSCAAAPDNAAGLLAATAGIVSVTVSPPPQEPHRTR